MSEHKVKEQIKNEISKKIKQRLLENDVTIRDFFIIDSCPDFYTRPSNNDRTYKIWEDLLSIFNQYGEYGHSIARNIFDEFGNKIADNFLAMPVPYDDRFVTEIMDNEHTTYLTARIYKNTLNTKITCEMAANFKDDYLSYQYPNLVEYVSSYIKQHDISNNCLNLILHNVEVLLSNQIEKIKLNSIVSIKNEDIE